MTSATTNDALPQGTRGSLTRMKDRVPILSIHELATIAGGTLRLSETPPLGGECEPIGNVVGLPEDFAAGDVVFVGNASQVCLESIQLRGAQGVIATRFAEPLPGCFSILIESQEVALQRLAQYFRKIYCGDLIVRIVPNDDQDDLCWKLIRLDPTKRQTVAHVGLNSVSSLTWCDADEVIVDQRLTREQRNFIVTCVTTNAPVRLAG